jgi:hypothetical protein
MELVEILVSIATGVLIGVGLAAVGVWIMYQKLKGQVDQMVEQVIQEVETSFVGLHIELDNGTYFCYNSQDKQYICQGSTVAEIRQAFSQRFPGKTAYLAGGDPELVEKLKVELSKLGINENSTGQ